MIVLVDVDDVVANLIPAWLREYNSKYVDDVTPDQIVSWHITSFMPNATPEEVYDLIDNQHFYESVMPVNGAIDGVMRLRELGHRTVFVTSAMNGHSGAKLRWLRKHGFLPDVPGPSKDYVECSDKALVKGDILIDDRIENVKSFPGAALLFDRPHNRDSKDEANVKRVKDWKQVLDVIGSLGKAPEYTGEVTGKAIKGSMVEPKNPLQYIDPTFVEGIGRVLLFGAKKYAPGNWLNGMKWSEVIGGIKRHTAAIERGEDFDPETKELHVYNLGCGVMFLSRYMSDPRYAQFDDRMFKVKP